ncbi:Haloalkane dehalogenase [Planctomycetes bacterium MalM25]|nr:Haloalkane dehalogenase [Planctomycetes bacterium MalM25]
MNSASQIPPEEPWRTEYPFESHWLDTPAGRVHYVDERPADEQRGVLLFVHGNPTWSFHWRRLISALSPSHRCVAIDHLGCGLSDKPQKAHKLDERIADLGRLVDTLDLRNVTLVAQDWGGAIGLGAMLDRQERLDRVLLFNTGAWPPKSIPARIAACRTPGLGKLALQGGNVFSRAALTMTLSRRRGLDPGTVAGYLAPYNNWANRRAVYEFVADIPTKPTQRTWQTLAAIEDRLPQLAGKPTRLVWGMRDWCFAPKACLPRFQSCWPAAETFELADVGHWVVEDAPDESLRLLGEFVSADLPGAN